MLYRLLLLALLAAALQCTPEERTSGSQDESRSQRHRQEAAADRRIPKPRSARLAPLDVGQWTRHRVSSSDGTTDTVTFKIVDSQQQAYWVEVVAGTANAGTVLALLVRPPLGSKPANATLLAARVKMPNGRTRELRGRQLEVSRAGYIRVLGPLFVPALQGRPQERQAVPAGSFEGCYRHQRPLAFGHLDGEANVWVHPSVPITGLVKAVDKTQITTVELVDYGLSGAKSSMSRR